MDSSWTAINEKKPPDEALVIYYIPIARYVWGCGLDYQQIKAEYPAVTHWKVATREPELNQEEVRAKEGT